MTVLSNDQREHLNFLRDKSAEILLDFCKLAVEYFNSGPNKKKYSALGGKLNTTHLTVQNSVEALLCLLVDYCKSYGSESDFIENLRNFGFTSEQIPILCQLVSSKSQIITTILTRLNNLNYRFTDLEWRLDMKVSSRSLLKQVTPIIVIRIHMDNEPRGENRTVLKKNVAEASHTKKQVIFQTDPNNLRQLIDVLEQALLVSRTIKA
ncbi:COMM domain-containing protein 2 [Condylostylus longicornis]|uniref:COMM domain-containing protein 2 n=1 Tax=Condylostylus longicornis TaxID=2530218 RepID=UPI00244DE5DD|nr:COMM domain-containing protein 2 [Condylostylus longicornis]